MSLPTKQQNDLENKMEWAQEHSSSYTPEELNRSIWDWQVIELRQAADKCIKQIDTMINERKQQYGL